MSTVSTAFSAITTGSCAEVIIDLSETALSQANLGTPNGVLGALTSDLNKQGFELSLDPNKSRPASGSHRKVYTSDVVPLCNQDTTAEGACASPSYSADAVASKFKAVEHRINQSIQRKITLDLDAFKSFCLSPREYMAKRLIAMRQGVLDEINSKLIDGVIAYNGNYADGTSSISQSKEVSFTTSTNIFDPRGYAKVKDEYAQLGHPYIIPIIVGGSHIQGLITNAQFLGGTNAAGVNTYVLPNAFLDYGVDVAYGAGSHLLTWAPGSIQAVGYNDVTDDMIATSVPMHREKMRIPDPFGAGLGTWDFYFNVDSTGCIYEMRYELWFDAIVPVPYDGTCGKKPILHFEVSCDANACIGAGSGA